MRGGGIGVPPRTCAKFNALLSGSALCVCALRLLAGHLAALYFRSCAELLKRENSVRGSLILSIYDLGHDLLIQVLLTIS